MAAKKKKLLAEPIVVNDSTKAAYEILRSVFHSESVSGLLAAVSGNPSVLFGTDDGSMALQLKAMLLPKITDDSRYNNIVTDQINWNMLSQMMLDDDLLILSCKNEETV